MKKYIFIFSMLLLCASTVFGQGVSLTISDVQAAAGTTVTVPITAGNFNNIGAVSLKIQYDPSVLTFVEVANKPASGSFEAGAANGELSISWFSTTPLNLGSGKFVDLKFTYAGGSSDLTFNAQNCEIANADGVPFPATLNKGSVKSNVATPVLIINEVNAAPGSSVTVPITATGFSNIGAISLKIQYDATALTFVECTNKPSSGSFEASAANGILSISWFSTTPLTIADNGKLVDLKFTYNSGSSDLSAVEADCEIADQNGNPIEVNYNNGWVHSNAPVPTIKINNIKAAPNGSVTVPVLGQNLSNVGAVSLKIQYNPAVLTYVECTNKPASGNFEANAVDGVLSISWFGTTALNIADGKFVDINFSYTNGTSDLNFDGAQCEVADQNGTPIVTTFTDGSVSSNVQGPKVTVGTVSGTAGSAVTVPINASALSNVGAVSLKIQYDASKLTFVDCTSKPVSGSFEASASDGVLSISWFSTTSLNIENGKFVDVNFTFSGGSSNLTVDKTQSEIADQNGTPIVVEYVNGLVTDANPATLAIDKKQVNPNTDVTLAVTGKKLLNVGAVSLKISYDPAVLTYKSVSDAPTGGNFEANAADGVLSISWFGTTAINVDNAALLKINFAYTNGESDVDFNVSECEVADVNGSPMIVAYTNGAVTQTPITQPTVTISNYLAKAGSVGKDITVPVNVARFNGVGSISIKIKFDSDVLIYKGVANAPSGNFTESASDSIISLGWFGTSAFSVTDGKLVDLKFTYNGQTSELSFDIASSEIANIEGTILSTNYVSGQVALNNLPEFVKVMIGDTAIKATKAFGFSFSGKDADGGIPTFSLEGAPTGATISASGRFSWTPTEAQIRTAPYNFNVLLTDKIDTVKHAVSISVIAVSVDPFKGIPTEYKLAQNHPNPFNPSTRIEYSLPKESNVVLKIYNVLGQEVTTLVNEMQGAGVHTVDFNASNMTTGLYLYKIEAGQFIAIKKMMLVK